MLPLFVSDVPLHCINQAAYEYHIPARLIVAVLNVERGRVGMANKNKNGTYDLGPMQINTSWWPRLYADGITPHQVLYDACVNVNIGALVLSKKITATNGTLEYGIGSYNSHTIRLNQKYSQQVKVFYTNIYFLLKE